MRNIAAAFIRATRSFVFLRSQSSPSAERVRRLVDAQASCLCPSQPTTFQANVQELCSDGAPIGLPVITDISPHLPMNEHNMFVANDEAANCHVTDDNFELIYILTKKPGRTVLYATDSEGQVILNRVIEIFERPRVMRGGK